MPNRKRNRPGSLTIGDYHWKLCDDGRYMMCDGHVGDRYQCGETESLLVEMLYRCEQEKAEILNRSARDENGLAVTCPASRHAEQIAEELIEHGSCGQLDGEGKHAGRSILSAVRSLYAARAEIARLTAEVERHRMTEEEKAGVAWAAREAENWADENDDEHDQTHGQRALALRALLDRTAPKEAGRE